MEIRLCASRPRRKEPGIFFFAGAAYDDRVFANLLQLITGRPPPPELEHSAFVKSVRVQDSRRPRRDAKVERFILVCWLLITVKHVLVIWACTHYPVPYHQLWINFPTWLLGVLATAVYYLQARKQ